MTAVLGPGLPLRRIIVFRALQLGDLLCAVPAFRALRRAFPDARISLAGLPGAREFVQRYAAYLDEWFPFPGIAAFPEQAAHESALPDFYRRVRAWHPDVAVQMHGSGAQSNAVVQQFGADRWAGFVPRDAAQVPGARLAWPDDLPEIERYLALLRFAGVTDARDTRMEFPCSIADERDARALLDQYALQPDRLVLIHVGARLASRRWPLARYAQVARQLHQSGWQVALTGTMSERALTQELQRRAQAPLIDLSGQTHLGSLAALVRVSRLLICNDTGISHIAAAVQTPSVVIACGSDVHRWAPLDRRRHRVLAAPAPCRPCAYPTCPIGHPCAWAVMVDDVMSAVQRQLHYPERRL